MSDDLEIGGPTGTSVVTTELVQEASVLTRLVFEIESCQRGLLSIDSVVGNGLISAADAPQSALLAEQAIDDAAAAMGTARQQCEDLWRGLSRSAEQYELAENAVVQLQQYVAAGLGHLLGSITPLLLAMALPGALLTTAAVAAALAMLPEKTRAELFTSIDGWLKENSRSLTDPRVVTAVRLTVMSADDYGMGLARLPQPIASALGDEGLGLLGVNTSAAMLALIGPGLGLLRETPVQVTKGATTHGSSNANDIRDRLTRIPNDPAKIRIDRYSSPGLPDRFEVYIGGTEDFSPVSGSEPFDLTSNVSGVAGGSDGSGAASYRAVVEAMTSAGIDSTSPVEFNGYSQGGLIATQLVASGDYTADALITVGAPAGQVSVPHDVPYLAIEHTDDLVPALGGTFESSDPLVVRRRVFDEAPSPSEPTLPAHRLSHYLDTATLIDDSSNLRLRETLDQLWYPQYQNVDSTTYTAERVTE